MPAKAKDDESLKRLGGGRWQTRDERFTIEAESGTWVVVDSEQTDDLGLPLVRGPFSSLTAAKGAIATARTSEPATSPLAGRGSRGSAASEGAEPSHAERARPRSRDDEGSEPATKARSRNETKRRTNAEPAREPTERAEPPREPTEPAEPMDRPEPRSEPDWIADLAAGERGRARRLIAALTDAGIPDAEGIVRRDLAGDVPAVAAVAVGRRLAALGDDADPREVAAAVAEGRDEELGVRWRLVDGEGRPILIEAPRKRRAR